MDTGQSKALEVRAGGTTTPPRQDPALVLTREHDGEHACGLPVCLSSTADCWMGGPNEGACITECYQKGRRRCLWECQANPDADYGPKLYRLR